MPGCRKVCSGFCSTPSCLPHTECLWQLLYYTAAATAALKEDVLGKACCWQDLLTLLLLFREEEEEGWEANIPHTGTRLQVDGGAAGGMAENLLDT